MRRTALAGLPRIRERGGKTFPSVTSAPAPTMLSLPDPRAAQDHGAHADEAVILHDAPVEHGVVSHGHPVADHQRQARIDVERCPVLDVGAAAHGDAGEIPAQGGAEPDARLLRERHLPDDLRVPGDERRRRRPSGRLFPM